MSEWGTRLGSGLVCPAASEQAATDQAAAVDGQLVLAVDRGWVARRPRLLPSWRMPSLRPSCPVPSHATCRRHDRAGERRCTKCRLWRNEYNRPIQRAYLARQRAAA